MISFYLTLMRFFRAILKSWSEPNFRINLLLALIILISGTFFYSFIEGWSIIDALYFSTMTVTTIGYGDLHPTTDVSKIFTVFYALIGIGIFVALMAQMARSLIQRDNDKKSIKWVRSKKKK